MKCSMRSLVSLLLMLMIGRTCAAQLASAAGQPAPSAWGGYALPAEVPYQPTLDVGQAAPSAGANPVWQTYPGAPNAGPPAANPDGTFPMGGPDNSVYLDGAPPPESRELAPGVPLYPGT